MKSVDEALALRVRRARVGLDHPETFARIRAACGDQSCSAIDLTEHAAMITLDVIESRARPRGRRRKRA